MSSEKIDDLRELIYKEYEFWLGCHESDATKNEWVSGVVHAYRNVLNEIDGGGKDYCPCHLCKRMRERKENR